MRVSQLTILSLLLASCGRAASAPAPNMLVIAIDDLRDELGCYGASHIHSPHIDRLAERGVLFDHAYCQKALCGPSRNSVFSGVRPDTARVIGNQQHFRQALPDIVAMPQLFKNHGYLTRGLGKFLHDNQDDPVSWTLPSFFVIDRQYALPENTGKTPWTDGVYPQNKQRPLYECADVPDDAYRDGVICQESIATIRFAVEREQPFFVIAGFHKPHTPFNAPKRYWDLYSREDIALAPNPFPPEGAPAYALLDWPYVRSFQDIPDSGPMPDDLAREVKHAYFACISYIDAQVGKLLAELDALGIADNTVVALWSDHGYQLGEHGLWCKHTNFETSTKAPLIIADPRRQARGVRTGLFVELIDLFPTLAELAGLPPPAHLEGKSLAPLFDDPGAFAGRERAAFSQFTRAGLKGVSIRVKDFRYTEWRDLKRGGPVAARELYDHRVDPLENRNAAADPRHAETIRRLAKELESVWPRRP